MTARCYVTVAVLALLLSPGFAESLFMDSCTYLFDNGSATDMSGLMAAYSPAHTSCVVVCPSLSQSRPTPSASMPAYATGARRPARAPTN